MAFVGFATMNPIAASAMLDNNRWRTVVYADTPRSKGRYELFLKGDKKDQRKAVLFLMGAANLHKVVKDAERFASVLIFDDLQNLHQLSTILKDFEVVDIDVEGGTHFPRHLTPAEMADVVSSSGAPPAEIPLLTKITSALGKRKPSVLESTSRMPLPEAVPESGAQRLLTEIKNVVESADSQLPFAVIIDVYTKFLFRMLPRNKVTSTVTKKLPEEAKDLWGTALDLANSDVGVRMALGFRALCRAEDPDYRVGHAVADYGLKPYSGDFLYFTSVLPPSRAFEFLKELDEADDGSLGPQQKFKPSPAAPKAKKKGRKKA